MAKGFVALIFLRAASTGTDSDELDAASTSWDAIFLRGARGSKIKGFLLKRGPSKREERDGNGEAGTEWKDARDESRGDDGGNSNRTGV